MAREDGGALACIHINPPLPCGVSGCSRLAMEALAESAPDDPALWQLLPICDTCMARLQQEAHSAVAHASEV